LKERKEGREICRRERRGGRFIGEKGGEVDLKERCKRRTINRQAEEFMGGEGPCMDFVKVTILFVKISK